MTDDDCEADEYWLETLVRHAAAAPSVGLFGGTVVAPARPRRGFGTCPSCYPSDVVYDPAVWGHHPPDGFECIGANFAFTRRTAEIVGPFDEYLGAGGRFPAGEEEDFEWRAVEKGIVMESVSAAVVRHTYGWRCGVRTLWNFQGRHAKGNGGYAAKLTLLRDPRGARSLKEQTRLIVQAQLNPAALTIALRRHRLFSAGYHSCLAGFGVDGDYMLRETARARS